MLTKEITNRYQAVTRGIPRQRGWGSENREEQFSNRCQSRVFSCPFLGKIAKY